MVDDRGSVLAGRYRLIDRVGAGGMGAVWSAHDELLDRTVAVKRLHVPAGSDRADAHRRLMREARIGSRLHHPNAITVFDVVEDAGTPVLVMEYLPSRSLETELAESGGRVPPARAAAVGAAVASALAAAHAAGIVHRDVKPGNVLLGADGSVKLTDFGIAHAETESVVTRTGLVAGTPAFLAPEVARGQPGGPAADVFSLGATLFTAVEGEPPFGTEDNAMAQLHRVAAGGARAPRRAGPLTDLLTSMLADDAARRPDVQRVADELAKVVKGQPALAVAEAPTLATTGPIRGSTALLPPAGTTTKRRRIRPAALAAATVAAIALVALLAVLLRPDERPADVGSPASTSTSTRASSTPVQPTAAASERAVSEYYALLPDDPAHAWDMLGPALRASGFDEYERFWNAVQDLQIVAPPRASGSTVTVTIAYLTESQGRTTEMHRLGMAVTGGDVVISSDVTLSASTSTSGEDDKNGNGNGNKGGKDGGDGDKHGGG